MPDFPANAENLQSTSPLAASKCRKSPFGDAAVDFDISWLLATLSGGAIATVGLITSVICYFSLLSIGAKRFVLGCAGIFLLA
jgi:hypothetical protein